MESSSSPSINLSNLLRSCSSSGFFTVFQDFISSSLSMDSRFLLVYFFTGTIIVSVEFPIVK